MVGRRGIPTLLLLPVFIFGGLFFFAPDASAAIVQCGIQNPYECQLCHVVALINSLISFFLYLATSIAALLFAYAGFLYFTSGGSEENVGKAKTIFKDVLIGFIIALCAWLIIDTLLRTLAKGQFSGPNLGKIECVSNRQISPTGSTGAVGGIVQTAPYNANIGTSDCAPGNLQSPTGATWDTQQRQVFSCIAVNESGCQPGIQNSGSSAVGMYQILVGYNNNGVGDTGHNLDFASCTQAAQSAGYSVSGNLNCGSAFRGSKVVDQNLYNACIAAAKNVQCNTDAAQWLYQTSCKSGSSGSCYSPWLGSGDIGGKNQSCVQKYSQ